MRDERELEDARERAYGADRIAQMRNQAEDLGPDTALAGAGVAEVGVQGHDWGFSGAAGGEGALVIAVCRLCGLIRTATLRAGRESRVDLGGRCPEDPRLG